MKTQYLNINEYKYKVEYIPYEECSSNEINEQSYVMFRNFSLMNNIVVDDNIYFVEKNILDQYKDILLNEEIKNDKIVFPSNKDTMYYSTEYHVFNDTYIDDDILNGNGVYEILEKKLEIDEFNETTYNFVNSEIPCDLVKIYHPSIKSKENLIIHIENVINNIHFHYLCRQYSWYFRNENNLYNKQYNSNDEQTYENNTYSEYIKCYIPSIRELFDRIILDKDTYDYKWYYKENLNITDTISELNSNFIKNTIIKLDENKHLTDDENSTIDQYVPITLFTQPYSLEEYAEDRNGNNVIESDEKLFKKIYFKYKFRLDNSYVTTPLNISLYPYNSINETTKIYSLSSTLLPGTASIIYDYSFSLASKIDFNENGQISLLCYFDYPFKELFEQRNKDYALTEAYCFYNHIKHNETYLQNLKNSYLAELDEINSINDVDDETIDLLIQIGAAERKPTLTSEYPTEKDYYIAKLKESRWQVFLEEYIDEFKATIDFFGFKIEIASDKYFKNIILDKNISLLDNSDLNSLHNEIVFNSKNIFSSLRNGVFFFPLIGLFTDWKQMPEIVVARITFIDRFIGNELRSNEVFISKEKFKYITNIDGIYRINKLVELNKNYTNDMIELNLNDGTNEFNQLISQLDEGLQNDLINWKNKYCNDNKYSFINNISCIVKSESKGDEFKDNKLSKTNIIYKPIFFKTNQLNNLTIKYMQNQNIGIDLHEYMSKVNSFILTLDGNTYYEIGRNSNFVLFNINAINIKNEIGTFEIYNDDHEYITYGNWSILR